MHDPMTVAFDIKYPWYKYQPWPAYIREWDQMTPETQRGRSNYWREGYRETFITIWHVDPNIRGDDDSCGYTYPKLSSEQKKRLQTFAWHEANYPYFLKRSGRKWAGTRHEAECIYRGLVLNVAHRLGIKMSFDAAAKWASETIHATPDMADILTFEPGYHSNFKEDRPEERERYFYGIICGIARSILANRRPWWRHPKWHIRHWKIQCHPIQAFKRWAFSRCCKCGKRFKYGYAPCSGSWFGTGPLWFRSERYVYHSDCSNPDDSMTATKVKAK